MAEVLWPADSRRSARYARTMRYAQGGGLTAEDCARREQVRLEAAEWIEEGATERGGRKPGEGTGGGAPAGEAAPASGVPGCGPTRGPGARAPGGRPALASK